MQFGDKGRCGAAAAAHHRNTDGGVLFHFGGKAVRIQFVAAVRVGQTRIGFDKDRNTRGHAAAEALREGQNLLGAERAVDAHGVRAETRCRDGVAFDGAAREGAPAALKAHRGNDRRIAVFLAARMAAFSSYRSVIVSKDEIGPCRRTGAYNLSKLIVGKTPACPRGRAVHPEGRCPTPHAPVVLAALRAQAMEAETTSSTVWPQPVSFLALAPRYLPAEYPRPRWRSQCGWPLRPPAFPARPARVSAGLQTACL